MALKLPSSGHVVGLDIGAARIGVAVSSVIARLPQPLEPVVANEYSHDAILAILKQEKAEILVVGIPRNLEGAETKQSMAIRDYVEEFKEKLSIPLVFVDESLSSVRADEIAKSARYKNVSTDSLAACFILEEYFQTAGKGEQ